jgi:glucan phosphoethanolaminetransferase (alkaline phosphatase superfamily)
MPDRFLRPLLVVEFLIALQAVFAFWSEAGGQYHLDLMFWPWKAGLSIAAAGLIVAITARLLRSDGAVTRRVMVYFSLLIVVLAVAGLVTYYYHLNEPADQDEDEDDQPTRISRVISRESSPDAARIASAHHR